jgi:hypothetical protein
VPMATCAQERSSESWPSRNQGQYRSATSRAADSNCSEMAYVTALRRSSAQARATAAHAVASTGLDPIIDSGREAYVVVDVPPTSRVAQCGCRRLLGELPHRIQEAVARLSDQVDVPAEQRAPKQVIDRVRHVVAHKRAGGVAVEGTHEH